jgi:hypothetical protein
MKAGRLGAHRGLAASIPSKLGGSRPALLYFDDARRLLRRICVKDNPSRLLHDQHRRLVGVVVSSAHH